MFIEERHQAILEWLKEKGSITTAEIQQTFRVGYDSAKRDLRILEEKGLLTRTHGGAIPVGAAPTNAPRPAIPAAKPDARPSYTAIARYAASMIADGDTVYLPATPIGQLMARYLPADKSVRVVTNSLVLAGLLAGREGGTLLVLGGEADTRGECYSDFALEMLARIRLDKCFLEPDGLSAPFGLSVSDGRVLAFCAALLKASKKRFVLCPGEKIGAEAPLSAAPADRFDAVFTDSTADAEARDALREAGAAVILADEGGI